jgi:acyl carrier protein
MDNLGDGELREIVRETLREAAPVQVETCDRETSLVADLGYHSLAILEAIFALEEKIGMELIDYGGVDEIATVGDVEDYVVKLVARAGVTAANEVPGG